MAFLHHLDLRMRCTLQTLHQILVLILQYSSTNHNDAVTKNDPDVALAEIIKSKYNKFGNKKSLHKDPNKDYFYDDPRKGKDGLRKSIKIESLDCSVICMILRTAYLTSIADDANKCCVDCHHECTRCNVQHLTFCDTETGDCKFGPCANCNAKDCDYIKFILLAITCRAFRNTNAHITTELCNKFQAKTEKFKDFPDSDEWPKIWNVVNKAALDCLKFWQIKGYMKEDDYKDNEVNLRIAYNKDANFLISIAGSYIDGFRKLIIGEAEMTEHLKKVETCLREGNKILSSSAKFFYR